MSTDPAPQARNSEIDPEKLRFLGLVGHELRTPLNAIIGFSNMIEQQLLGPVGSDEYVEFAHEIQQSGKSLLRLIDDLIISARAEAEGLKPAHAHVDLATAVATAVRDLAPMARQKRQSLVNLVDETTPALWGDGRAVRQAIGALLDNALKFTPELGGISIEGAYQSDGDYRLTVADAGPGFGEKAVEDLMQAFRQGDTSHGRAFEGAGLGLYITRQLMAMHEGRVEIDNGPNGGALVSMIFPRQRLVNAEGADDMTVMTEDATAETAAVLALTFEGQRRHLFLGEETLSIGRKGAATAADDCDLLVEDRRASRDHAQIISIDGRFHVIDESRRGTYVAPEGGPIEHVHLNVSAPLTGAGVIALGDQPDAEGVARIAYSLTTPVLSGS